MDRLTNDTCDKIRDVQNFTDHEISDMLYSRFAIIQKEVIIPIIFTIGFFGNGAFFVLLVKVKAMRTTTNFYLANLAAADLMILFFETFMQLLSYLESKKLWSEPMPNDFSCGIFHFAKHLATNASILLITLVSFDRYFAICYPIKYRSMKQKRYVSYIITLLLWTIAAILGLFGALRFGTLK